MRPVVITQTGAGTSSWVKLDNKVTPFNVGFGCVVTGTVSFSVEYTYDDVDAVGSPTAFTHATVATKTANIDGTIGYPVAAVRINNASGTGSITMTLIQAGCAG